MNLQLTLKKYAPQLAILFLVLIAFSLRAGYLIGGVIPFSFDHGKDSLAIMDMVVNLSPKFIGPWTSIPGLYFGPAWYYLLAPFYLFWGLNPVAGAWAMLILVLVQLVLAAKFFSKYEAVLIAFAPLWMTLSRSAWNPFPMTLISWLVLIFLMRALGTKVLETKTGFCLGLAASFGFHFSAAFAIFYPVIIILALLIFRTKVKLQALSLMGLGFLLPFLPQFVFELKHGFGQTKAIIAYFQNGESQVLSLAKITFVAKATVNEVFTSFIPEMSYLGRPAFYIAMSFLFGLGVILLSWILRDAEIRMRAVLTLLFVVIPIVGFCFLHFNIWYVYAMAPAAVMLVGSLLRKSPIWFKVIYLILLGLGAIVPYYQFFAFNQQELSQSKGFLPIKLEAVTLIQEKAGNKPYASYHFVSDIYDFSYQYLYFWKAFQGAPLPVEFSYRSGESTYFVQKADLLRGFPKPTAQPELIFYIVEKPGDQLYLDMWWYTQKYSEIIETITLSPNLTIYIANP